MNTTCMNGLRYYVGENRILLPTVSSVLKATQPRSSINALSSWRHKIGEANANSITLRSRNRGNTLHLLVKQHLQGVSVKPNNSFIEPFWYSIQPVLNKISDVKLIEAVVPNYKEVYAGKVDSVACYQNIPHVIEWTTSEEVKVKEEKLYDKPLQLVAYAGAINRCWNDSLFGSKINHALIVVALPGKEAEVFEFDRAKLIKYWKKWNQRLQSFYHSNAAKRPILA
ncbi:hypothetical protein DSM106972_020890 [Dulcicalothrix desertica PCC 7102]|uniref:Uncharacterized protein n=1 Tax=Dulcicalothrix desertica PCC 7102 TaxID=232991 RepID=A0A433VP19_9CYAN|nr:exonuclease [Dulcicalothrix desertica]RUT07829.1 hypothetical protein DSM106972_020890 [Dulcicalothrix desertica PCC 7102]TWH39352.1 genome maintenance exonuclease 1 [Dulcicalothrix desertica PCC 7102]